MKKVILSLAVILTVFSCKKDNDSDTTNSNDQSNQSTTTTFEDVVLSQNDVPAERTFTPIDANTITSNITIDGSTKLQGTPPTTTTDLNTPVLMDPEAGVKHYAKGTSFQHSLEIYNASAQGVYLKFEGADDYFDIPIKSGLNKKENNGSPVIPVTFGENTIQLRSEDNNYFDVALPQDLEGEICFNYCVYDTNGLVSNVISQCVVLESIGGNLPFSSSSSWNLTHKIEVDGSQTNVKDFFITDFEADTLTSCYDSTDFTQDTIYKIIQNEFQINSYVLKFNTDGTLTIDLDFYSKFATNTFYCSDEVEFDEQEETLNQNGYWSYDETTETLVLVFSNDNDNSAAEMKLQISGNEMLLTFEEDETIAGLVFLKD